jgi:hypothetical protein
MAWFAARDEGLSVAASPVDGIVIGIVPWVDSMRYTHLLLVARAPGIYSAGFKGCETVVLAN